MVVAPEHLLSDEVSTGSSHNPDLIPRMNADTLAALQLELRGGTESPVALTSNPVATTGASVATSPEWSAFQERVRVLQSDLAARNDPESRRLSEAITDQMRRLEEARASGQNPVDYVRASSQLNDTVRNAQLYLRPQDVTQFTTTGGHYNAAAYTVTSSSNAPTINGVPFHEGRLGICGNDRYQIFGTDPNLVYVQQVARSGGGYEYNIYTSASYQGNVDVGLGNSHIALQSRPAALQSEAGPITIPSHALARGSGSAPNQAEEFATQVNRTIVQLRSQGPGGEALAADLERQLTRFGTLLETSATTGQLSDHLESMQRSLDSAHTQLNRGPFGLTRQREPSDGFRSSQSYYPQAGFNRASYTMELTAEELQNMRFRVEGSSNPNSTYSMTYNPLATNTRTVHATGESPLGINVVPIQNRDGTTVYRVEFSTANHFQGNIQLLQATPSGELRPVVTLPAQANSDTPPISAGAPHIRVPVAADLRPAPPGAGGGTRPGPGSGPAVAAEPPAPAPLTAEQLDAHVTGILNDPNRIRALLANPSGARVNGPDGTPVNIAIPGFPGQPAPDGAPVYQLRPDQVTTLIATAGRPAAPGQAAQPLTNAEFSNVVTTLRQISMDNPANAAEAARATMNLCQDQPHISPLERMNALNHLNFTLPPGHPMLPEVNARIGALQAGR